MDLGGRLATSLRLRNKTEYARRRCCQFAKSCYKRERQMLGPSLFSVEVVYPEPRYQEYNWRVKTQAGPEVES